MAELKILNLKQKEITEQLQQKVVTIFNHLPSEWAVWMVFGRNIKLQCSRMLMNYVNKTKEWKKTKWDEAFFIAV